MGVRCIDGDGTAKLGQNRTSAEIWRIVVEILWARGLAGDVQAMPLVLRANVDRRHRRGLGTVVVQLLLDHPAERDVDRILLNTRDAQGFYERFGFRTRVVSTDSRLSEMSFVRTNATVPFDSSNLLASVGS